MILDKVIYLLVEIIEVDEDDINEEAGLTKKYETNPIDAVK